MKGIYKRKDGRFEGRYFDENKNRRSVYGQTEEEVIIKITKLAEKENEKFVEGVDIAVSELFEEWINSISLAAKESTVAVYINKFEKHIRPEFGNRSVNRISAQNVRDFAAKKLNEGLSANYTADIVSVLKSMFKFAVRQYNIPDYISGVLLPKRKKTQVSLLSDAEQKKLMDFLKNNSDLTSLAVALALFMGLRIGEICALQWKDVDFENNTLTIGKTVQRIKNKNGSGKTKVVITEPKSETSARIIPVPDCILSLLKKFRNSDDFFIISGTKKPFEPRTIQYRFCKLLKKENLPSIHFHALRHMFACNCVALGFDIKSLSEILGHSKVEITLNRYVHSSLERKKQFMQKIDFAA